MEHQVTQETLNVVRAALDDPSAMVRRAAVQVLSNVDPRVRGPLVSPLLADAVRTVRTEAALAVAGVPAEAMTEHDLAARERATTDFIAAQKLSSDRPEGHLGLAALYAKQQLFDQAESELKRALAIDPAFVPAAVNLADLYGTMGRDAAAEPILRAALGHAPNHPALLHALGLTMVREKRTRESLGWLAEAARRGQDNPRYGFVYAVALHDDGWKRDALKELEGVLEHHPYDRDSLAALAAYLREAGEVRQAQRYGERLEGLGP
jgi:tetratricopeptide (TPR) repeat protein